MTKPATPATVLPEWVTIDFGDGEWNAVYHGGRLVGVGSPDYAWFQVREYLGTAECSANPGLGSGGQARIETPGEDDETYEPVWAKYGDSSAPKTLSLADYNDLVAR